MTVRTTACRARTAATAAVALTLVLAGCSGTDAGDGPTEITFSYLWGGKEAEAIEAIIADFNESQDDIVVRGVSSPDTQKQLTSMSSSRGSFDVSDHFGSSVGAWAPKGILAPLDECLAANGVDTADFAPATMSQMVYDGTTYAMPIAVHTVQLVYNKQILDEAGIAPPTTMDELAAAAKALTEVGADGTVTRLGLGAPELKSTLTTLGLAFGGTWDGDGTEPTPAEPENVAALQWWHDTVVEPVGADALAEFTAGLGQYLSPEDPFFSGKYAMVLDGEWLAVAAPTAAPDTEFGVVEIPAVTPELAGSTQVTTSTLFIPANSQHKEEACELLSYLLGEGPMTDFTLALGNLPSRTLLLESPAYDEIPNFDVWLDALASPNAKALASQPYSQEYLDDLGAAFDKVVRDIEEPQAALEAVAERAKSYARD